MERNAKNGAYTHLCAHSDGNHFQEGNTDYLMQNNEHKLSLKTFANQKQISDEKKEL